MSISRGLNTVNSGLVFYYDISNYFSYPGSGTIVTDLTGNSNNLSLINSPTYSSSNLEYLSFVAASSQYGTGTILSDMSNFTCETWFTLTGIPGLNKLPTIVTQTYPGTTSKINFSVGFNGAYGGGVWNGKLNGGFYDGQWRVTNGFVPTLNKWYQFCVTYDGSSLQEYINGANTNTVSYSGTPQSSGDVVRVGRRWDTTDYISANIAIIKVYNKALSAADILQNFNAARSRFGL